MYCAVAVVVVVAALVLGPWRAGLIERLLDRESGRGLAVLLTVAVGFYGLGAAAVYRLLLRFASHVIGNDAIEEEIRSSEGRTELNLRDR